MKFYLKFSKSCIQVLTDWKKQVHLKLQGPGFRVLMQSSKMTRNKGMTILLSACLQSYLHNGWLCLTLL